MSTRTPDAPRVESVELDSILQRVGLRIHQNLMDSGLANQIVMESEHAAKPKADDEFPYDRIWFDRQLGEALWVIPRLACDVGSTQPSGTSTPRIGTWMQPVVLKIHRLARDVQGRNRLAERIWSGVTDEERHAALRWAIRDLRQKYEGQRRGAAERREKLGEAKADRFIREAETRLEQLQTFEDALATDRCVIGLDPKDASLRMAIVTPTPTA